MDRIKQAFPFVIVCSLVLALENTNVALSMLAAALIHELGHYIVISFLKGNILKSDICAIGANISYAAGGVTKYGEVAVCLGGPCLGAVGALAGHYIGFDDFAQMSFFLTVLNLIPCTPLDGGFALYSILPYNNRDSVMFLVSFVIGVVLCCFGFYMIIYGRNFTFFVVGAAVLLSLCGKTTLQQDKKELL